MSQQMIACVAIIGRTNTPLFIKTYEQCDDPLKFHYTAHTTLDVFQERCSASAVQARAKTPNVPQDSKNYLGMLFPTEHYRIYGYITTTNVKFVLVLNDQSNAKDPEIRNFFNKLHSMYVDAVLNPFYSIDEPLTSKRFEKAVNALVAAGLS